MAGGEVGTPSNYRERRSQWIPSHLGKSRQVTVSQLSSASDNLSLAKAIKKCSTRGCSAEQRQESAGSVGWM